MGKGISPSEYDELKRFLSFYSERFMSVDELPAELRPMACLERLENMGRSKASQGLRQAINDIIESTRHWDKGRVASLDAQLVKSGVVTLSELRRRFSKEY